MRWQESERAVVTGGGSGLGRALAVGLAKGGARVLVVGRREEALRETAALEPEQIDVVAADVATAQGRADVAAALAADHQVRCLIHNAGVLEPVGPLHHVDLAEWEKAMAINVAAPLFLTQALLPRMVAGSRILHISSGVAHQPLMGWGVYSAGKAALYSLYQTLRDELWGDGLLVGSVRPGVVDTPMQALVRSKSAKHFPAVDKFIKLKENGQLYPPEQAADFALWALLETADKQFVEQEWNISNEEHKARWRATRQV